MIFNLGGIEVDLSGAAEAFENDPNAQTIWEYPDRIADMAMVAANTRREIERESVIEMLEAASIAMILPTKRIEWKHLNLGGVSTQARLYSLIMLHDEHAHLTQADYNFLCGVDVPGARLSLSKAEDALAEIAKFPRPKDAQNYYRDKIEEDLFIDPQQKRLGEAFVKMMVQEAEPHLPKMLGGAFVME